jgi:RIO kinase 1
MSQMRSKRKRRRREDYMLSEQLKIEEGVFDNRTMQRLGKLFTHGIISSLGFLLARGKEADFYIADPGEKIKEDFVGVKIFRIETSSFFNRIDYMLGDPRFPKIKRDIYWIVNEWCKKEYGNLKIAETAGVHAPRPYYFNGNVLAMEFIGYNDRVASQLKLATLENPREVMRLIIEDVKRLYENELVHADLSEYNVLMKGDIPYIIDFGQAVVTKHPNAMHFLRRDVENIVGYFNRKYGLKVDSEKVYSYLTKNESYTD